MEERPYPGSSLRRLGTGRRRRSGRRRRRRSGAALQKDNQNKAFHWSEASSPPLSRGMSGVCPASTSLRKFASQPLISPLMFAPHSWCSPSWVSRKLTSICLFLLNYEIILTGFLVVKFTGGRGSSQWGRAKILTFFSNPDARNPQEYVLRVILKYIYFLYLNVHYPVHSRN